MRLSAMTRQSEISSSIYGLACSSMCCTNVTSPAIEATEYMGPLGPLDTWGFANVAEVIETLAIDCRANLFRILRQLPGLAKEELGLSCSLLIS